MKKTITLLLAAVLAANLLTAQNAPESADKVLKDACTQASAEKKNVLILFHASWCGWCRKFEASVNDPSCKEFFDKNFVIKYLTILESKDKKKLENPGANEMYEQYGGKGQGIPYFLIFDKKGNLLADSKMPVTNDPAVKRNNIGCPSADDEIAAFVEILKKTSKINDSQIAAIKKRFSQNKN